MGNALWLLIVTPKWYFSTVAVPLAAGLLTFIPALSVVGLLVGIATGILSGERRLLLFLLPFSDNELLVAIAGFARGRFRESNATMSGVQLGFLAAQIVAMIYLVYVSKSARISAVLLAAFTLTYAVFSMFVASMSFSDTWL